VSGGVTGARPIGRRIVTAAGTCGTIALGAAIMPPATGRAPAASGSDEQSRKSGTAAFSEFLNIASPPFITSSLVAMHILPPCKRYINV
jgi:hypothetical protein